MFAGVFNEDKIALFANSPNPASITLIARNVKSAVEIAVCIFVYSFAPRYWEIMTEAPTPPPMAIIMNTVVNEYEAPTAASASSPTNLPTITESAIL